MPIEKQVIKPGTYYPRDEHGEPYKRDVTWQELWSRVGDFKRMKAAGYKVPLTWEHQPDLQPIKSTAESPDAKRTAGYVTDMDLQDDGWLKITVDPLDAADEEKIRKIPASVFARGKSFTDGDGNTYEDPFLHVALSNQAVVNGQPDGIALSMALTAVPQDFKPKKRPEPADLVQSIAQLTEEFFGVSLGIVSTPEEVLRKLEQTFRTLIAVEKRSDGNTRLTEVPEGTRMQPRPRTRMSFTDPMQFALATIAEKPSNPDTDKPWTADELQAEFEKQKPQSAPPAKPPENAKQVAFSLIDPVKSFDEERQSLFGRIEKLVQDGAIAVETAEGELVMSLNALGQEDLFEASGKRKKTLLDTAIEAYERQSKGAGFNGQSLDQLNAQRRAMGFSLVNKEKPANQRPELTPEKGRKDADEFLKTVGVIR